MIDLLRAMSPRARLTAGVLLAVIAASTAYLVNYQTSGGAVYLLGGEPVAPSQWPAMVEAFARANLADYELEDNRIRVPRGRQAAYMGALADAGALPHNFGSSLRKTLENSSPWIGKRKQEEMLKVAMQDELAKIIGKMSGVDWATVMYDVQTPTGLNSKKIITASVTIKPVADRALSRDQVQMVRNVVAPAIGAAPESVAVVDLNGRTYPAGLPGDTGSSSLDLYVKTKLDYEQRYTEQIRELLGFVSGAVVAVNVELRSEIEETESSTRVDSDPVSVEVTETTRNTHSNAPLVLGRTDAIAQGGLNVPAALGSVTFGAHTQQETTDRREQKVVGSSSHQVRKVGLTPKRVTVSVGIPSSYFVDLWRQRNPAEAGAEPARPDAATLAQIENEVRANIQRHVLPLIPAPIDSNQDANELVTVTTFPTPPSPEMDRPSEADINLAWLQEHAGVISLSLLGIVGLLVLRSIARSAGKAAAAKVEPWRATEAEPQEIGGGPGHQRNGARFRPSLHEELAGMVRDDPDAAANILRSWIGSAN